MKVSDYIVEYLIKKNVKHVFGYPGGMVTHLMDSFSKYGSQISAHLTYHEQGAAFAACGYAQASGNIGVAYATSGPGATNLITGICDAYFDSIPVLFITGQVNTFESKDGLKIRQRGFQETDIVSMVSMVTKYAHKVEDACKIKWYLDFAYNQTMSGRKGPVLLDIPMNIFRSDVNIDSLENYIPEDGCEMVDVSVIEECIKNSKRPVLVLGNGIKQSDSKNELLKFIHKTNIPVVSTMLAVDVAPENSYGFIGAYGSRAANFIVAKSDLVITFGARCDVRQVGAKRENFAPSAKLIRIDVDKDELDYRVHEDDICINGDIKAVLSALNERNVFYKNEKSWNKLCNVICESLENLDDKYPNKLIKALSAYISEDAIITTDVGQNQVWVAQSLNVKSKQRVFFSGGHGAMGYSLPAAIGCALATGKTVYSFNGDGGIQMNIQELQTIVREKLPIKIIVFNNYALGMIRHFQEMYFNHNYYQTTPQKGYTVPSFIKIFEAYGIRTKEINTLDDIKEDIFSIDGPELIEINIKEPTYVFPKLEFGKPNQDQEPLLDRCLYNKLMEMDEDDVIDRE